MFNMYVKKRVAAIVAIFFFLFVLPEGMPLWLRAVFAAIAAAAVLWVLPTGGVEPDDSLTWERLFLAWPMVSFYAVLGIFVWWLDGVWWSLALASVIFVVVLVLAVMFKGSIEQMEGTHTACM